VDAARSGRLDIGTVVPWQVTEPQLGSTLRYVLNFPTKRKWRGCARPEWIEAGLANLRALIAELNIRSVALPALGCGQGGLEWSAVRPMIESALGDLSVHVIVYEPATQRSAPDLPRPHS
jgi:O-acetyl-ADP-ribose deacetylase (regulator of RNase III)